MVTSKQHLHPRCFIDMSTPLRLGCSGLAGATLKKTLPGTRHFFESDYTRAPAMSCLEICMGQICFSDSLPGERGASGRFRSLDWEAMQP